MTHPASEVISQAYPGRPKAGGKPKALTVELGEKLMNAPIDSGVSVDCDSYFQASSIRASLRNYVQARGWKLVSTFQDGKLKLWRGAKL